jgi:hypothetical protein
VTLVSATTVDLARAQFATTTLYHFLFVPLTLGLGPIVATFQTLWRRTGDESWLRLTHFFGALFLINFAIGVATGLVQEFQFGMNWSVYSKFVGNVFGAPLAIEGLAAFFLESTFLGLWIFGWDRLPQRVHLGTIWAVFIGTNLSAYFILAANAWMQRPVGAHVDRELSFTASVNKRVRAQFAEGLQKKLRINLKHLISEIDLPFHGRGLLHVFSLDPRAQVFEKVGRLVWHRMQIDPCNRCREPLQMLAQLRACCTQAFELSFYFRVLD